MLVTGIANSSPLEEKWNVSFYEKNDNFILSIIDLGSKGFIVAGSHGHSASSANSDGFLYGVSPHGDLVWRTYFGGDQSESFSEVLENGEQDYLAIGSTASSGSGRRDALIVKVDSNGSQLWNRTLYQESCIISSAQRTSDGNLVLAGIRAPLITAGGNLTALLIKADSEGNEIWAKNFGSGWIRKYDSFSSVQETPEGGFIMAGITTSFSSSKMGDGWMVKVDSKGNEMWNRSFGDVDIDMFNSVSLCADGGYIAAGKSKPYGKSLFNAWMVKTDTDGNLLWEKRYLEGSDSSLSSIVQTPDGNYIVAGSTGKVPNGSIQASFGVDNYQGFLMKIDDDGEEIWSYVFDTYSSSVFNTVIESNGCYVVGGSVTSKSSGESDALLVLFEDTQLINEMKKESIELKISDQSKEEKSPISFTITLAGLGLAFIMTRRRL
jgi:hypothetical protein